jgi:signal transduction histidine kinase
MVCIPVILLTLLGTAIFAGLRFTDTVRQSELALLWPERGASMSVSYSVSALRDKMDTPHPLDIKKLEKECHLLERQGIRTVIVQNDGVLYATPGSDAAHIRDIVRRKVGPQPSAVLWEGPAFYFVNQSRHRDLTLYAAGSVAFIGHHDDDAGDNMKTFLEFLAISILVLAIIIIIWLGIYLSRLLSRHVLEPLTALQKASAEIKKGNLEYTLDVSSHDELGKTCHDFDTMRRELKSSREKQEKYEQNRKELIAGISHDLSTPLTLLKGYASGIRDGIASTPEKQRHYVDCIYTTACAMEQLVDKLFLFSKLDLGRMTFTLKPLPIYRYIYDVVQEIQPALHEQGLDVTLTGPDTPAIVTIDSLQFRRVLENLISNSLKYKQGDTGRVEFTVTPSGRQVRIDCIDHGMGAPPESLSKLFDSFYRTDAARSDIKGNGLGLAIAKQILTGMGGTILALETPGGGLTIRMTLPLAEANPPDTKDTKDSGTVTSQNN